MKDRYTIGEVAALLNISPQTLRFYDKNGVVVPYCTDPKTGYRYAQAGLSRGLQAHHRHHLSVLFRVA